MNIHVEEKFQEIIREIFPNDNIIVEPNDNYEILYGYPSIINKANNKYSDKTLDNSLYISISYGIGNYTSIFKKKLSIKSLRKNLGPVTFSNDVNEHISNFVILFYITISYKDSNYSIFSCTVPIDYKIVKDLVNKNDLIDNLKEKFGEDPFIKICGISMNEILKMPINIIKNEVHL